MIPHHVADAATALLQHCQQQNLMIVTAESCTGGLIAGCLTEIAGSSATVDRGFVTYSNEAKNEMIDVPMQMIDQNGAVSEPVAIAMAEGALQKSRAHMSIAVTGVAGPGGGSFEKPVGLVHLACAARGKITLHQRHCFADRGRAFIRWQTVLQAMRMLRQQSTA